MSMNSLREEVIVGILTDEVIVRGCSATQTWTVFDLLNVAQTAGDTFVAVGVERIEVERNSGVAAGVDFALVQDWLYATVNNLWSFRAGSVQEVVAFVDVIVSFDITITQREFDGLFVWLLATEFGQTIFDGCVHRFFDSGQCIQVILGDQDLGRVFFISTIDGDRFPSVEVGQAGFFSGYDFRVCFHFQFPP